MLSSRNFEDLRIHPHLKSVQSAMLSVLLFVMQSKTMFDVFYLQCLHNIYKISRYNDWHCKCNLLNHFICSNTVFIIAISALFPTFVISNTMVLVFLCWFWMPIYVIWCVVFCRCLHFILPFSFSKSNKVAAEDSSACEEQNNQNYCKFFLFLIIWQKRLWNSICVKDCKESSSNMHSEIDS